MKQLLMFAFFCCFIIAVQAQPKSIKKTYRNKYKDGLKTGGWITYPESADSPYYCLTVYSNGKPTGVQKYYTKENRHIVFENDFADGKLRETRRYHDNGRLYLDSPFSNGRLNGTVREYYESGLVMSESSYSNGLLNGFQRYYYPSGKIKSETQYANNLRNGMDRTYDEDGRISNETKYVAGDVYFAPASPRSFSEERPVQPRKPIRRKHKAVRRRVMRPRNS